MKVKNICNSFVFYCCFYGEPKSDIVLNFTLTSIVGNELIVDNDFGWGLFYFLLLRGCDFGSFKN